MANPKVNYTKTAINNLSPSPKGKRVGTMNSELDAGGNLNEVKL